MTSVANPSAPIHKARATQVAVVQHCAGTDVAANMASLTQSSRQAREQGAELICWPEAFAYLGSHRGKKAILEPLPEGGPILAQCQELAKELDADLLLGGFHEACATDPERCYNTSVYLSRDGQVQATYRKIHLFDVNIVDGPQLMESRQTLPGESFTTVSTPCGVLGLSVCYDVRFPALYQALIKAGAIAITVPSAFTAKTGAMHWHALLRARAIECQCYVIAPAQHGRHSEHRASYGHSLIVDPWGEIIAELPQGDGYAMATVDPDLVAQVRQELPSLANQRDFA